MFELAGARVSEMIMTSKGAAASSTFFDFMAKSLIPYGLRQFRAIQKKADFLHLQLVYRNPGDKNLEEMIKSQVNDFLGDEMQVEFEYLEEIVPDKSGKLRYFIREEF